MCIQCTIKGGSFKLFVVTFYCTFPMFPNLSNNIKTNKIKSDNAN